MKFCTDCWNFDRCNAIGRVVDFSVDDGVCRDFDECKPQTNADRIRAMSDGELVVFLDRFSSRCLDCAENAKNESCQIYKEGHYCRPQDIMEWLQKPAEGE